jgi:hypothetical protein
MSRSSLSRLRVSGRVFIHEDQRQLCNTGKRRKQEIKRKSLERAIRTLGDKK